jgi:hypothetical protein
LFCEFESFDHQEQSKLRTFPPGSGRTGYTKKFAKDCLRISMAYTRYYYPTIILQIKSKAHH